MSFHSGWTSKISWDLVFDLTDAVTRYPALKVFAISIALRYSTDLAVPALIKSDKIWQATKPFALVKKTF